MKVSYFIAEQLFTKINDILSDEELKSHYRLRCLQNLVIARNQLRNTLDVIDQLAKIVEIDKIPDIEIDSETLQYIVTKLRNPDNE